MNRQEFFENLNDLLKNLSENELKKANTYYNEIIDDYMEDGLTEEAAIQKLGDIEAIAEEILSENSKNTPEKAPKNLNVLTIVLLVLGFPLWGSLLLAAACILLAVLCILFSCCIVLFCPLIVLWSCVVAFFLASVIVLIVSPFLLFENLPYALFQIGTALTLLGLSIILLWVSKVVTKYIVKAIKVIWEKVIKAMCIKSMQVFKKRRYK